MSDLEQYCAKVPLLEDERDGNGDLPPVQISRERNAEAHMRRTRITARPTVLYFLIILPWTILIVMSTLVFLHRFQWQENFPIVLYSPVQDFVEYEIKKFRLGLHDDLTEFQGTPSPELDETWKSLYKMGISAIPLDMARQLPNRTAMIPHDPEKRYIIQLDVFHQLHCLNAIRKALHPEYYNLSSQPDPNHDGGVLEPHHVDHCVDAIRQSLMCNADITPLTWLWDESRGQATAKATVVHKCRRFDKIQEWAEKYNYPKLMDRFHKAENDPLDPTTWADGFSG